MIFTLDNALPVSTSLNPKSLTLKTVDVSSLIVIVLSAAIGVSFTPFIVIVKVPSPVPFKSVAWIVNTSVTVEVVAFITLSLVGTYTYLPLSAPVLTTYNVP